MLFLGVFVISNEDDIREFAERFQITFPVGKDSGIARALGVTGIPETVFVSSDGRILGRFKGPVGFADLESGILNLLD